MYITVKDTNHGVFKTMAETLKFKQAIQGTLRKFVLFNTGISKQETQYALSAWKLQFVCHMQIRK